MEFSCDYLDQLPPAYRAAVEQLLQKVEEAEDSEDCRKLFETFYRIYTMIPEVGKFWTAFAVKNAETYRKKQSEIAKLRRMHFKHFYFEGVETLYQFQNIMAWRPKVRMT